VDQPAELPLGACLVLEVIPEVLSLTPEGQQGTDRPVQPAEAACLPGVPALVSNDLAERGERLRSVAPSQQRTQPAGRDLDRMLARGRLACLLAQQLLGTVPTHRNDRCRPGDQGAAPEGRRPATVGVAALRGEDVDHTPLCLATSLAVDAETGRAAEQTETG